MILVWFTNFPQFPDQNSLFLQKSLTPYPPLNDIWQINRWNNWYWFIKKPYFIKILDFFEDSGAKAALHHPLQTADNQLKKYVPTPDPNCKNFSLSSKIIRNKQNFNSSSFPTTSHSLTNIIHAIIVRIPSNFEISKSLYERASFCTNMWKGTNGEFDFLFKTWIICCRCRDKTWTSSQ